MKPNGFIINDMKEGSSYYPYYGYAYNNTAGMERKNPSAWVAGYQAVEDWLGLRQDRHAVLAAEFEEQIAEEV